MARPSYPQIGSLFGHLTRQHVERYRPRLPVWIPHYPLQRT